MSELHLTTLYAFECQKERFYLDSWSASDRAPERLLPHPGIDLRRRDLPMPEGALDKAQAPVLWYSRLAKVLCTTSSPRLVERVDQERAGTPWRGRHEIVQRWGLTASVARVY